MPVRSMISFILANRSVAADDARRRPVHAENRRPAPPSIARTARPCKRPISFWSAATRLISVKRELAAELATQA